MVVVVVVLLLLLLRHEYAEKIPRKEGMKDEAKIRKNGGRRMG